MSCTPFTRSWHLWATTTSTSSTKCICTKTPRIKISSWLSSRLALLTIS
ncbi:hypothetical protein MtrunA17_Chr3g0087181 [Medicago truncatula]|uniref:Uncharacterized protein n=1 Tax=Medicago truncatula TaxID=3880 RepID=A0A396IMY0_MEDTR|nr:hypothetical protein MtrunA17_Chr3g0087181 [Medicago truncatula]